MSLGKALCVLLLHAEHASHGIYGLQTNGRASIVTIGNIACRRALAQAAMQANCDATEFKEMSRACFETTRDMDSNSYMIVINATHPLVPPGAV